MVEFERRTVAGWNCGLSVVDFGGEGRPDLIVVHGTHDHALGMYPAFAGLLNDYRVVALDLRGHGWSDKPGNYSIMAMVADLRAVVVALELSRPTLLAHSLGGEIAVRYAALYPTDVVKLAMLDGLGPPLLDPVLTVEVAAAQLRSGVERALGPIREGRRMADRNATRERFSANYPNLDAAHVELIVDHAIEAHPDGGVRWRFDGDIQFIFYTFTNRESEAMASLVECPVLLLTGDGALEFWRRIGLANDLDQAAYEKAEDRRCALFANGRRSHVANAAHMLHYDQPETVSKLLRGFFLG